MSLTLLFLLSALTAPAKAAQTVYLPHYTFVDDGWSTTLSLNNPTNADLVITIRVFGNDGAYQTERDWLIAPGAGLRASVRDLFPTEIAEAGWLEIVSAGDAPAGLMTFTHTDAGGTSSLPVVANSGRLITLPLVRNDGQWVTGLAAVNPNDDAVHGVLELVDSFGTVLASTSVIIDAKAKFLSTTAAIFNVDLPEVADVRLRADQPLVAFALTFAGDFSQIVAVPGDSRTPQLDAARIHLSGNAILNGTVPHDAPVDNQNYLPMGDHRPASLPFEGRLQIPETAMSGQVSNDVAGLNGLRVFPAVTLDFFTQGDYLVPVQRGVQRGQGPDSYWHVIVEPGKVWREAGDGEFHRASFAFTLVNDRVNDAFNGVAMFLYTPDTVSDIVFQVTQETSTWLATDFWGTLRPQIDDFHVDAAHRDAFAQELRRTPPMLPWSVLEHEVGADKLAGYDSNLAPHQISATGLMRDGVTYLMQPMTRHGRLPYPRYARHGVYSLAKTNAAMVGMLALAQAFGDGVFDARITDYVAVSADHNGWDQVTFADCLNMSTGVGDRQTGGYLSDESSPKIATWIDAPSAAGKLEAAFSFGNFPWGPGEVVKYNTTQTFVLAVAMQAFLDAHTSGDVPLWDWVVEQVYAPIGFAHTPMMHTVESNGGRPIPLMGVGLYPTVAETAALTTLMQNGGAHQGRQLLHANRLAEALFQTDKRGLTWATDDSGNPSSYLYAMRSLDLPLPHCPLTMPFNWGAGGNVMGLLPNGITMFRFTDSNSIDMDDMGFPIINHLRDPCDQSTTQPADIGAANP